MVGLHYMLPDFVHSLPPSPPAMAISWHLPFPDLFLPLPPPQLCCAWKRHTRVTAHWLSSKGLILTSSFFLNTTKWHWNGCKSKPERRCQVLRETNIRGLKKERKCGRGSEVVMNHLCPDLQLAIVYTVGWPIILCLTVHRGQVRGLHATACVVPNSKSISNL